MATITLRASGDAPVELAWERYARPELWSQWSPQISRVDIEADRIGVGLRGTVHGRLGLRVGFLITAVDEPARRWAWRVYLGPLALTLRHRVDAEPNGSSTSLTVSGLAPVVVGYAPLARLALANLVRANLVRANPVRADLLRGGRLSSE
jgi:Polyketide cyclase / dehydrase and lipid transport